MHNHARLWFASIWIFTLKLPWELGAAFFLEHLHDGDPASNTLSWRWVAGLHTKGKNYVASADNIEKFTDGKVTGKTGSLTGMSPKGRHDWFVGYGVAADGRRIAFASLIINKEKWYVRSSYVARKFLEHYFTNTPSPVDIDAVEKVTQAN